MNPIHGLGAACRPLWRLDPAFLTVNHGSFGATPIALLAAQTRWRERMEAQPSRFMRDELPAALRAAAEALAAFLGARGDDLVFVDNATSGCNAVLRSFPLRAGDAILTLSHGYGAVRNAARHLAARVGARVDTAVIPFPHPTEDAILASIEAAITPATRLAVIDHITSGSALVLPAERIAALCHTRGVAVLVDGAHAPGQITLDVPAIGADFYTGNCHKFLCAPKGSAFLWVAPAWHDRIHPTVISHGLGQGFLAEFDWTGTRDPSAALVVPDTLALHAALGGAGLRARNAALADEACRILQDRLRTERGASPSMMAAMGVVRLPEGVPESLRDRLLALGTDAPVGRIDGALWLRVTAFAYNEADDYHRLASLVASAIAE
jgi:isopenicillin-N epimerase